VRQTQQKISSNLTVLIINIDSTCAIIEIKFRVRPCDRFYLCRLFTIDWFRPEIVTGKYISRAGISNVIFPGGRASETRIEKNSKKY
jgi:hypothetical protein